MSQADEYLKSYSEFSKTLRTWFVAYGIGAPALMLTNKELSSALTGSGDLRSIAVLFLIGALMQVLVAAANKASMWGLYYGEITPAFKGTKKYRIAWWFGEAFWIDLLADVATLVVFVAASVRAFQVVVK